MYEQLLTILGRTYSSQFLHVLETLAHTIRIDQVFIVGSYAVGSNSTTSDLDLLIISSDFAQFTNLTRCRIVQNVFAGFPMKTDFFCFTPAEYDVSLHDTYWNEKKKVEVWRYGYTSPPCL